MPNKLEQDRDFIDWLKKNGCSDGIIDGISKFGDTDLSTFKKRVKKQPDLLTALVENGYGHKAIGRIFRLSNLRKCKYIAIELSKNKCEYQDILTVCGSFSNTSTRNCKKFFKYKKFYIEFIKKYSPLLVSKGASTIYFSTHCSNIELKKCLSNKELLNLLTDNDTYQCIIKEIVNRSDYKAININNNKELLDFLLNNQLITFDEDKLNFIRGHPLITSLLKTGDLTISSLSRKNGGITSATEQSIREVVKESTQKNISESRSLLAEEYRNQKLLGVAEEVILDFCDSKFYKNKVLPLQVFAAIAVLQIPQKIKAPPELLNETKVANVKTHSSRCIIS